MKIVTERELGRDIVNWWGLFLGQENHAIRHQQVEQLRALGDDPTVDQIAGVIGKHWAEEFTQPCCTECGADVGKTMRIEGIDHVEGADIGASFICLDCLQEAVKRLQEPKP